jgi:uncharacterized protein YecT (DUF1311 family)
MKEKLHAVSASARLHGTPAEEELAHSQDIWWQYVRETCEGLVKSASADEPIGSVDVLSCRVELTLERTRDLDRMFYVPLHD